MALRADRIIYSDEADAVINQLLSSMKPEHVSIRKRIAYLDERLVEDCQSGEVIPLPLSKKGRPLETRHAPLHNLYCCDLPAFWRFLYTIIRDGPRRIVYVLEIVDHPTYDRWFPERGR